MLWRCINTSRIPLEKQKFLSAKPVYSILGKLKSHKVNDGTRDAEDTDGTSDADDTDDTSDADDTHDTDDSTREHNKNKRTKESRTQKKKKNERWAKGKRKCLVEMFRLTDDWV